MSSIVFLKDVALLQDKRCVVWGAGSRCSCYGKLILKWLKHFRISPHISFCNVFFQMITSSPASEPKWISGLASPTLVFLMHICLQTLAWNMKLPKLNEYLVLIIGSKRSST
jgi:hypothetical protein